MRGEILLVDVDMCDVDVATATCMLEPVDGELQAASGVCAAESGLTRSVRRLKCLLFIILATVRWLMEMPSVALSASVMKRDDTRPPWRRMTVLIASKVALLAVRKKSPFAA